MAKRRVEIAVMAVIAAALLCTAAVARDNPGAGTGASDGAGAAADANPPAGPTPSAMEGASETPAGEGMAAVAHAAEANKYLFIFFHRSEAEQTQSMKRVFDEAVGKVTDKAEAVVINASDPLERAIVDKFGVSRAPMPLVLVLAANGAITKSLLKFDADQLAGAFVSPCSEKCLKALQDRKLVLVCVQNGATQHNTEAMRGVQEFLADPGHAKTTEIITLDPGDAAEAGFLEQLKVDPKTEEAVTVFMAPPGTTVGTYQGETKKDVLVAAAKTAGKGCNPKSGCCPPKKPAAPQPGSPEKKP